MMASSDDSTIAARYPSALRGWPNGINPLFIAGFGAIAQADRLKIVIDPPILSSTKLPVRPRIV